MNEIVWLVSYPRSGNTWLRFLLANILYPDEEIGYVSLDRLVPDSHSRLSWEKLGVSDPWIIKNHYVWCLDYSKIIYIYRDVRDVALSCYYWDKWRRERVKNMTLDKYLREIFFRGERLFGRWDGHVKFWLLDVKPNIPTVLIKYEELWQHPYEELRKIIEFLEIKVKHTADIQIAIDKSAFGELKKIRERDGVDPKKMGLKGQPGGWRKNLTEEQKELIWKEFGKTMEKLGYEK